MSFRVLTISSLDGAIVFLASFFVTRSRKNMDARRRYSNLVDRSTGVVFDQTLVLQGGHSAKDYPESFRRIRYRDPETGKRLLFITNNTALPALKIWALYKAHWQVELFFRWIKQHLRIKAFFGTSENAVKPPVSARRETPSPVNLL
jgi:hypothetical protein